MRSVTETRTLDSLTLCPFHHKSDLSSERRRLVAFIAYWSTACHCSWEVDTASLQDDRLSDGKQACACMAVSEGKRAPPSCLLKIDLHHSFLHTHQHCQCILVRPLQALYALILQPIRHDAHSHTSKYHLLVSAVQSPSGLCQMLPC